ncbi:MAG: TonB-dependent receptor domain-containing protein [Flavisolibacter sp.]
MRSLLLLLLATAALGVNAQQVSGLAKDTQGTPLTGATITLFKAKDTSVVKLAVSKDGAYSFADIKEGEYRVGASYVGFTSQLSAPFAVSTASVKVPDFKLEKAAADLKGIVVTAKKPIVEVKADKTILNVEGTINATGSDALDLLRKSPGVTVDKDENLSLSGKNGVQVYIDGRPTPLSGQDLANYLKSLNSSQIEAIELITNPSAKYEAAGNAGIINIRLKKNKALGTNGTVNAGYNVSHYSKYNAGFSINHRNRNINIFGNYNYNQGKNLNRMNIYRSVADSIFDNEGEITFNNKSHNFKAGADYFLDKKNTVGVMVNGNFSDPTLNNYSKTAISYAPTKAVNSILIADNTSNMKRNNINYNANYSFTDPAGKSLTVNADYGSYTIRNDQYQPNNYYDASGQNLVRSNVYEMIAPSDIDISSVKADWEQNFAKGKLGFGGKTAFVKSDNDFQRYNVYNSGKELDKDRSNRFTYKENINAGYVNYNRPFKGFMIQAGLRVENTNTEGVSKGLKNNGGGYQAYDSTFERNYTDLFPSAAITFNKNPMNQLSLTYSRRIDRPAYQDLNPFEFKLDDYLFQKGNINLRPQYTNSFGITHTYKYRLNTTLNYSHVKDMFVQLADVVETSKAVLSKKNLASQDIVSLNMSYPFQYKSYSVFGNLNTNYSHYKANFGDDRDIDLKAFALSFYAQNSLRFAKTWTAEVTGFYNAPTVYMGAIKGHTLWSVDAGLQKQLFNSKATIKASVSDVFNSLKFRGTMDYAGQKSEFSSKWESRQFKLSLSFRFGNNGVKAARQRNTGAEEETKRVQQSGGGGIGIGN